MNIEKVIDSLKGYSLEELNRIQEAIKETSITKRRGTYDHIEQHINNIFQKLGAEGYGFTLRDCYDNGIILYPSELNNKEFDLEPFHKTDKPRCEELGLDLPREDRD